MAEYLGEGRSPLRGGRPSRETVDLRSRHDAPAVMKARSRKPDTRQASSMKRFMRDFRGGISALGDAVEKLLQFRHMSGDSRLIEKHTDTEREKIRNVTVPHVLEREILTAQQAAAEVPFRDQPKRLLSDYKDNARQSVAAGIPQFLAAMLKSEAKLRSSEPMRPTRGGAVEALMKVAKSVKAGRLPFVPKETRRKAQELLDAIYSKRTGRPATWRDKEIAHLVEKHRLIPLSALAQPSKEYHYQNLTQSTTAIPLVPPLPHHKEPERILKESEARSLEAVMPRFRDEGVASGPKVIDAGESTMHTDDNTVVYRDNSSHVSNYEQPAAPTKIRPASTAAVRYRSPKPTTRAAAVAPTSPEHEAPKPDASRNTPSQTSGGLGSHTGGGTVGASGGQTKIQGELRIPQLDNALAEIKGFMTNG